MTKRYPVVSAAIVFASAGLAGAQSFTEGFETTAVNGIPAGWVQRNQSVPMGTDGQNSWFVFGAYNVIAPQAGSQQVITRWLSGAGLATLNGWLIMPVVSLRNGDTFSFWTRMYSTQYPDRLQLRMSTAGVSTNTGTTATDVGDFTTLLVDVNPTYTSTGYPIVYTQYSATVSGLPAEVAGRFAFRYFVENGGPSGANSNVIGVDEVAYVYTGSATTGACCMPSGACNANQTSAQCTGAGGIFQGLSTVCGNCPQPGACCFADGTCQSLNSAQCTLASGVFRGDGTNCSPNLCPQPGACCLADGSCSSVLVPTCTERTGVFRGTGVACPSVTCPQPFDYETAHGDVGETRPSAAIAIGTGALPGLVGSLGIDETDVYDIFICDPTNFRASTVGWTAGGQTGDPAGRVDTLLWLFNENGTGVECDDDSGPPYESLITGLHVTHPGRYYLAVSGYLREPRGATTTTNMWMSYGVDQVPNGPAAAEAFGSWITDGFDAPLTTADSGFYTVALNGACYVDHACYANCDGSTTLPCLNVLDFGCFLNKFAANDTTANCDNSTTAPVLNVLDFGCFLNKFASGCSNC